MEKQPKESSGPRTPLGHRPLAHSSTVNNHSDYTPDSPETPEDRGPRNKLTQSWVRTNSRGVGGAGLLGSTERKSLRMTPPPQRSDTSRVSQGDGSSGAEGMGLPILGTTPELPSLPDAPAFHENQIIRPKKLDARIPSLAHLPALPDDLCRDISEFKMTFYAPEFFRRSKTQLNKKNTKVPLERVLEFTKVPIKTPLLSLSPSLSVEAIDMFKYIMMYMGDKKGISYLKDADDMEIAQVILKKAVHTPHLRDELFCQIIKQSYNNPSEQSTSKGWELMCMVFEGLQPSQDFEEFVVKYFHEVVNSTASLRIRQYAAYCLKRLEQLRERPLVPHLPWVPVLESVKEAPFLKSIFRTSLQEVMTMQKEIRPGLKIPLIVKSLTDSIIVSNGIQSVGIFRVAPPKGLLAAFRKEVDDACGLVLQPVTDPNLPACLLKEWLTEIRYPLVPEEFYEPLIENSEDWSELWPVLDKFTEINKNTLFYLVNFFQRIAQQSEENKMTFSNLAVVLSPTFCRTTVTANPQEVFLKSKLETQFVCTLLENLPVQNIIL